MRQGGQSDSSDLSCLEAQRRTQLTPIPATSGKKHIGRAGNNRGSFAETAGYQAGLRHEINEVFERTHHLEPWAPLISQNGVRLQWPAEGPGSVTPGLFRPSIANAFAISGNSQPDRPSAIVRDLGVVNPDPCRAGALWTSALFQENADATRSRVHRPGAPSRFDNETVTATGAGETGRCELAADRGVWTWRSPHLARREPDPSGAASRSGARKQRAGPEHDNNRPSSGVAPNQRRRPACGGNLEYSSWGASKTVKLPDTHGGRGPARYDDDSL